MPNRPIVIRAENEVVGLEDVVDGFPSRLHQLKTRVGAEPLEYGQSVLDWAEAQPEALTLTGVVSDFAGGGRPRRAFAQLRRWQQQVVTVRVLTELGGYPEMVIKSVNAHDTGRGLSFDLELVAILRRARPARVGSGGAGGRGA